ncbi:hypothetical protein TSAR_008690 [Trichomalopsis sarcophagae]|uniref:Uncharacterized protein n=1 Tax=Trichomalopsis sarcophagae TaxID=543379 RepID=A0A232EUH4_9HYME|nr:hypothetical protein TSAR_008690 [Trichomalopsis sarcophagae]
MTLLKSPNKQILVWPSLTSCRRELTALLIKPRRKLGPAKPKTLSRGLPKGLEAVRALLYIYSYTHPDMYPREHLSPLDSLAWQSQIGPLASPH